MTIKKSPAIAGRIDCAHPSPHLIPWPDLKDSKTGNPLNLEAFAQLHHRLSTVLLEAAQTFLSEEVALALPCDDCDDRPDYCWRGTDLFESAEKFANTCLVASVREAEYRCIAGLIADTTAREVQ